MKKLLPLFAIIAGFAIASAQVFNQSQIVNSPFVNGGIPYATSSAPNAKFSVISTSTLISLLGIGTTTNSLSSSGNLMTSVVNGISSQGNIITFLSASSTGNGYQIIVNGVPSNAVDLVKTSSLSFASSTKLLTSIINGVTATTTIDISGGGGGAPAMWATTTNTLYPLISATHTVVTFPSSPTNVKLSATMPALTSGTNNIAMGTTTLGALTSGGYNIAIGVGSLKSITTGSNNVAIGYNTGTSLGTNTGGNVFIGHNVSSANSGSRSNLVGIGISALRLTTGSSIVAVGKSAGENISSGDEYVAIGTNAMQSATNPNNSVGVGYQAFLMSGSSFVSSAVGIGSNVAENNYQRTSGVFIGRQTAQNSRAISAVMVGAYTGQAVGTYDNSVLLGSNIFNSVGKTVTDSVFIGREATTVATTSANEIVIGYQAIGNGTNTVTLGNASVTDTYLKGTVNAPILSVSSTTGTSTFAGNVQIDGNLFVDGEIDTNTFGALALSAIATAIATASIVFTNKRIQPRTASSTSNANLTPDLSSANIYYRTTQTTGLTINAPTGTPVIGETIVIYVDSAGAQTLTMNATYIPFGSAFPASTTAGKTLMITAQYNGSNWKTLWSVAV